MKYHGGEDVPFMDSGINNRIDEIDSSVFERIIEKHDIHYAELKRAIIIVEEFIRERRRILVGGQSIDKALRIKGSKIYDDEKLPDLDFLSPEFHKDAYDLAQLLINNGFENVSAINALHYSTMRVRIFFVEVADVTYMPENVYNVIPTMEFEGFRLVHPYFQYIDQHRALSYPYENKPREAINRWHKDMSRHELFYEYYPFEEAIVQPIELKEYFIPIAKLKGQCLGGFSALAFWERHIECEKKYGFEETPEGITIKTPCKICLYSDDVYSFKNGSSKWFKPFADKLLRYMETDEMIIFDNRHMLTSAKKINDYYIANLQVCMTLFIAKYFINKYMLKKEFYKYYDGYIHARNLVIKANELYTNTQETRYLDFLPSAEIYGAENITKSYIITRGRLCAIMEQAHAPQYLPRCFFQGQDPTPLYDFDLTGSQLFDFDGMETEEFFPIDIPCADDN